MAHVKFFITDEIKQLLGFLFLSENESGASNLSGPVGQELAC